MYTVNATEVSAISKGIEFAKRHSIRLVVKNTGHDILGRYDAFIIYRLSRLLPICSDLPISFQIHRLWQP